MNDRELDRLLDTWMDLGPTVAPGRVADAARLEIRATRQSAPFPRFSMMNTPMRIGLAAAAVTVAALLGFNYLVAPSIGAPGPAEATTTATPLSRSGVHPLLPGRHQIDQTTWSRLHAPDTYAVFKVPAGWAADDDGRMFKQSGGSSGGVGIQVGTVSGVYLEPCHHRTQGLVAFEDRRVSVSDLADALARDGGTVEVTSVLGRPTPTVTLAPPPSLEACDDGEFRRWIAADGRPSFVHRAGQTDRLWLIDEEREMIIIHAWHAPDASAEDRDELLEVVNSLILAHDAPSVDEDVQRRVRSFYED